MQWVRRMAKILFPLKYLFNLSPTPLPARCSAHGTGRRRNPASTTQTSTPWTGTAAEWTAKLIFAGAAFDAAYPVPPTAGMFSPAIKKANGSGRVRQLSWSCSSGWSPPERWDFYPYYWPFSYQIFDSWKLVMRYSLFAISPSAWECPLFNRERTQLSLATLAFFFFWLFYCKQKKKLSP